MPTPDQIRSVLDAYVDGYNRNDREAVVALFAEHGELIDPVGAPAHIGADGIRTFWDGVREITENIELIPQEIVVCGEEAAMIFAIEARTGEAGMRMTAIDVFEFDAAGKISRLKAYWDMAQGQPIS
jgi:steroid Delta-isomerase